jgi:hypothetical protein
MEENFIAVPWDVTLDDFARVLRQTWSLDETMGQPQVVLDNFSRAYVAELDRAEIEADPLFFEDSRVLDMLRDRIGDYRLFALRYTNDDLGQDMTRAIARSTLAGRSMLVNANGVFVTPAEFLAALDRPGEVGGGRPS